MARPNPELFMTVVRHVARGVGENPDTLILLEPPAIPIKVGISLRLFTREHRIYSHLGRFEVERTRAIEKDEVEFVLRQADVHNDSLQGNRHLLLVRRCHTGRGWRWKELAPRIARVWRRFTGGVAPIPRFLPPSPPASPPATPSSSATSLTWPSTGVLGDGSISCPRASMAETEADGDDMQHTGSSLGPHARDVE